MLKIEIKKIYLRLYILTKIRKNIYKKSILNNKKLILATSTLIINTS